MCEIKMAEQIADDDTTIDLLREIRGLLLEILPSTTKDKPSGGYSDELFANFDRILNENLVCGICYMALRNTRECPSGHRFCKNCISLWINKSNKLGLTGCPVCRVDTTFMTNDQVDIQVLRQSVLCPKIGCNWFGYLEKWFDHIRHRHKDSGKSSEDHAEHSNTRRSNLEITCLSKSLLSLCDDAIIKSLSSPSQFHAGERNNRGGMKHDFVNRSRSDTELPPEDYYSRQTPQDSWGCKAKRRASKKRLSTIHGMQMKTKDIRSNLEMKNTYSHKKERVKKSKISEFTNVLTNLEAVVSQLSDFIDEQYSGFIL